MISPAGLIMGASGSWSRIPAATSPLPGFEIDARIDPRISEIRDQVNDQADQRENIEIGEHHRIVAVEHALEAQQAEPVEREDGLDQQRSAEKSAHEGAGQARDDDKPCV